MPGDTRLNSSTTFSGIDRHDKATLRVRGHVERRGYFVSPSGPSSSTPTRSEAQVDDRWVGRATRARGLTKLTLALGPRPASPTITGARAGFRRTLPGKTRLELPRRARAYCVDFFAWYNGEHYHSGIGLQTPNDVHYGRAQQRVDDRAVVLAAAHLAHPERFVRGAPKPPALPIAVWIDKPIADQSDQIEINSLD